MSIREIREGRQTVGVDERPVYTLTTTPWSSAPSAVAVVVYDYSPTAGTYTDVTATVMPGAASVVGDVITLPALVPAAIGKTYRVDIKFTAGGSVWECYAWVEVER